MLFKDTTMFYVTKYNSPLGSLTLACMEDTLVNVCFDDNDSFFKRRIFNTVEIDEVSIFRKTKKWIDSYFRGENPSIANLDLNMEGSEFRLKVWELLKEIPYGKVITYGDLAKKLSPNMSSQAVGGAVGHNPISIIVPCHRVVGFDGRLTGYAGGLENKVKLLELEGVKIKDLKVIF